MQEVPSRYTGVVAGKSIRRGRRRGDKNSSIYWRRVSPARPFRASFQPRASDDTGPGCCSRDLIPFLQAGGDPCSLHDDSWRARGAIVQRECPSPCLRAGVLLFPRRHLPSSRVVRRPVRPVSGTSPRGRRRGRVPGDPPCAARMATPSPSPRGRPSWITGAIAGCSNNRTSSARKATHQARVSPITIHPTPHSTAGIRGTTKLPHQLMGHLSHSSDVLFSH